MSRSIKEDYYWRMVMADKDKSTSKPQDKPQDRPSEPQRPIQPRDGEDEPPPPPGGVPVGPGKGNP